MSTNDGGSATSAPPPGLGRRGGPAASVAQNGVRSLVVEVRNGSAKDGSGSSTNQTQPCPSRRASSVAQSIKPDALPGNQS